MSVPLPVPAFGDLSTRAQNGSVAFPSARTRRKHDRGRDDARKPKPIKEAKQPNTVSTNSLGAFICASYPLHACPPRRRPYIHSPASSLSWNLLFFYFAQLRTHQDADFVQEQANRCDVRVQRFPGTGNDTCGLHVQRTGVRAMIGCAKAEHYAVNYVCM